MALRSIFYVYAREKGYKGGGISRYPYWKQEVTEDIISATLEDILQEYRI